MCVKYININKIVHLLITRNHQLFTTHYPKPTHLYSETDFTPYRTFPTLTNTYEIQFN